MRLLSIILFLAFALQSNAQTIIGRQKVDSFARSGAALTYALVWTPQGYANTGSKRYPLVLFLHGAGEYATAYQSSQLTKLIGVTSSPPGRIAAGWNAVAMNPKTGVEDSFIVVSPQYYSSAWSYDYSQVKFILPDIVSKYRIDTSRIYLTGLSAGGGGAFTCMGSGDTTFIKKFAAMATASSAGVNAANGYTAPQVEANLRYASKYGVKIWTVAGEQDYLLNTDVRYHDSTNKLGLSPPNKLTVVQSVNHSAWNKMYDLAFRPYINYYGSTGNCQNGCNNGGITVMPNNNGSTVMGSGQTQDSLNVFEWFLLWSRSYPNSPVPDADAGTDISITLPTSQVTLNGTGSSGGTGGTITGILWSQQSGPPCTITTPGSLSTTVTGMTAGTYIFRLRIDNNVGLTNYDNVFVTVNGTGYSHPTVTLASSPTQTISTTSATVSATYTTTNSAFKKVTWKKLKVPGQAAKKIVWIGSSTLAGTGASVSDSNVVNKILAFGNTYSLHSTSTNLSLGGTSIFTAMPTGYTPTGAQDPVDNARNVTAALNLNPDVVIIGYPSNDYDALTVSEVMFAYQTIVDTILGRGVRPVILTTQPREAFNTAGRLRLREIEDSLLSSPKTAPYVVPTHVALTDYDRQTALYNAGDNIHQDNTGHRVIAYNLIAHNLWSEETSGAVITSPNSLTTTITGLTTGTHVFMVSVEDGHGQVVNAVTTLNVTLSGNQLPTANAGPDQEITLPNSSVLLSGSGTDIDGTITAYNWQKISGPGTTSIPNPGNQTATATNLQEGTYVFRLTVTDNSGGQGTDDITVVVNTDPNVVTCSGSAYTPVPGGDGGYYNTTNLKPGDTLYLDGSYTFSYVYLNDKHGLPECPIVITNKNGIGKLKYNNLELFDCSYIKVIGQAVGPDYGIEINGNGNDTLKNEVFGIKIRGRSRNIHIEGVYIHNVGIGIEIKHDPDCDPQYQYPNWVLDSITVKKCKIEHVWNEGIYAGNTAPDNSATSYSPRPVVCDGVTTYPRPPRIGNIFIDSNYVGNTGRSAIQISSASGGIVRVKGNTVKNAGMNGDEAQGQGIVNGTYSGNITIEENVIDSTLTHGIASIGGASTTGRMIIRNNTINHSGYLQHYDLATAAPGTIVKISTEPKYADTLSWPYNIFLQTVAHQDPGYTALFTVQSNTTGYYKQEAIGLFDQADMFGASNSICGNINNQSQPVSVNVEGATPVTYSGCQFQKNGRVKFKIKTQ